MPGYCLLRAMVLMADAMPAPLGVVENLVVPIHPGAGRPGIASVETLTASPVRGVMLRPRQLAGAASVAMIQRASCIRLSTPSLLKMLARWLSTVRSEMKRLPATWAFVDPP